MQIVSFLSIVAIACVIGATTIASGQLFLAIREIALNTRKDGDEKSPKYMVLETVAKLNNFFGWLIIIGGVIIAAIISGIIEGGYRKFPF